MRWLSSRIPPISAYELGVLRVLLAAAFVWTFHILELSDEPFPREFHLTVHPLADWEWVHRLAADTTSVRRLELMVMALGVTFGIGAFTRVTYPALLIGATAWTLVRLLHTGTHNWSALLVALWAMWPVRWGDGFSVDALIRRARGRTFNSDLQRTAYGYAPWVAGLVFGAAMAGAGVAKLVGSGLAWITNASVKYHFVSDAATAPTDWGLWVARHHDVALLLSAGAIATECGLVFAVLVRHWAWRLPFAIAGFGLLIGFYVFQGEWWWAWWTLYLMFFVPWANMIRVLRPRGREPAFDGLTQPQLVTIAAVCALQIVPSVLRVEVAPIMSDYPMYSSTYESIEEFERHNPVDITYRFAVRFADGEQIDASERFDALQLDEEIRDVYLHITVDKDPESKHDDTIRAVANRLTEYYGRQVAAMIILVDERAFDWAKGQFYWRAKDKPVYTFVR